MAYHSTSGMANNTADFFSRFRSFIISTVGWSALAEDLGTVNPYLYISSSGENGRETVYLLFDKFTANADRICVRQALWWNPGASSAVQPAGSTYYNFVATKDSTTFPYWIYADLDHIVFVTRIGTTYNAHYFGTLKRYWSSNMALTQADVSAGSNIVVPVDNASYFKAGLYYQIINRDKFERMQVTAVDTASSPQTITAATLASGYAIGARVGEDVAPVMIPRDGQLAQMHTASRFNGWSTSVIDITTSGSSGGAYQYAVNDCRYNLIGIFPLWASCMNSGFTEVRGQLIEVYEISTSWGVSEDVIDAGGGVTYKFFYIGSKGIAIRE
ncbi:MAG: hypothetical protein GX139_01555 [Armatimonadetes bacterium]|jgi:hypothetical protein|nr:hypothetical protein [Armatimonadota bacterium]